MTDDVVQLAGDPRPLVAEGDLGEEFTLILELLDAQSQLVGGLPAQSQYGSGGIGRDSEHEHGHPAGLSAEDVEGHQEGGGAEGH